MSRLHSPILYSRPSAQACFYRCLADIKDETTLASIEMEFEDRFGSLPTEVENLIFQIKVKHLASLVGLASVGFEGHQLVLHYPPFTRWG